MQPVMQAFANVLSNPACLLLRESPVIAEPHEAQYVCPTSHTSNLMLVFESPLRFS